MVTSVAFGGSALMFGFGCLCCMLCLGGRVRARHTSRMIGTKERRVDEMPYVEQEYQLRGELPRGIVAGSRTEAHAGFHFGGLFDRVGFSKVSTD